MKKRTSAIIIIVALVGLISIVAVERGRGFVALVKPAVEPITNPAHPTEEPSRATSWEDVGRGVAHRDYWFKNSTQGHLTLYRFDQRDFKVRLIQHVPAQSVRDLFDATAVDTLMVNGVYFDEKDLPVGYTVIDGNRIGKGVVNGKTVTMVGLSPKVQFGVSRDSVRDGFQTYPVLIKNGTAAVATDSKLYARRTMIGTDTAGNVYVGVVPDSSVSLYEFSRTLEGLDISWDTVVNLDGGPSSGLVSHFGDYREVIDSMTTIPNVLLVERR